MGLVANLAFYNQLNINDLHTTLFQGDSSGLALLEILVRSCIGRATDDASIVDFFRITLFDSEDSLLKLRMPTASSSSEKLPRLLLIFYFIFCLSANLVLEW